MEVSTTNPDTTGASRFDAVFFSLSFQEIESLERLPQPIIILSQLQ